MRSERGVALITVLLVVAIAAALAGHIAWRQQVWTRQVENLRDAAQTRAVAQAALDWVGLILTEDRRAGSVDHLGESWATPIRVPVEYGEAAGALTDLQGRFNLNNLVRDGQVSATDVSAFRRLLTTLELDPDLADALVDWLDADALPSGMHGAEDDWYLAQDPPRHAANRPVADVAELQQVRGFSAAVVERLAPYVCALPGVAPVNVNTAPAELLVAYLPGLDLAAARRLVQDRGKGYANVDELRGQLSAPQWAGTQVGRLAVASDHFRLELDLTFGRVQHRYEAVYRRQDGGKARILWARRL